MRLDFQRPGCYDSEHPGLYKRHQVRMVQAELAYHLNLWEKCLKALREEAHIRMTETSRRIWRREDLEQVIRQHEGYLASSAEIENHVKPTNWPDLLKAMRDRHAALIIGQSGTGKIRATDELYRDLHFSESAAGGFGLKESEDYRRTFAIAGRADLVSRPVRS